MTKKRALSYFDNATKYAKPRSTLHASYALLHKALIYYDAGNVAEAEKASYEAVRLSPGFSEALYQNAQYNAQLSNVIKSTSNLEKAVRLDKLYCLKASADTFFDPIRGSVNDLFKKLKNEEKRQSSQQFKELSEKYEDLASLILDVSKEGFVDASSWGQRSERLGGSIERLRDRIKRDSYFDYLELNGNIAPCVSRDLGGLAAELRQTLKAIIDGGRVEIKKAEKECEETISDHLAIAVMLIVVGSFIVPAGLCLWAFEGWSKLYAIAFCIPLLSQGISLYLLWTLLFHPSELGRADLILVWGIVVYLAVAVGYYGVVKLLSKDKKASTVRKESRVLRKAKTYLEKAEAL